MEHLEQREWKLRAELAAQKDASGSSALTEMDVDSEIARLQRETGLSPITLRVCVTRGLTSASAIHEFLSPKLDELLDPMKIADMDRATERLVQARDAQERMRVFGDYDVDGTTGAALLAWVFREFGYQNLDVRQPDRFKDGYGLNVGAVEEAAAAGVKLLVTVDCGITSFAAAEKAAELGVELIVVDHHQLDAKLGLPLAYAVINPQRPDCPSGLKQLCGCGLAFYVARALRTRGRELQWWPQGSEPNLKKHLDLVVMATAADMVPLTGDNHVLVRHGLQVLKYSSKPGVRALLDAAGLGSRDVSPGHLGFVIGPRINASGRMVSADLALELLTTEDPVRAASLALELERLNKERADLQNRIWDEVRERVEKGLSEGRFKYGIAVADSSWHEGVVGIVASRVTETFRKPAAVIALREDFGKGSVRSYAGKDVLGALRASAEYLLGFGGHKHAAGLSVALDQFDAFADAFDAALEKQQEDVNARPLLIEGVCRLEDLDLRTLMELENLGPFGPGNPEPVFVCKAAVKSHRVLKERHLKMTLGRAMNAIDAIWFHAAERADVMESDALHSEEEAEWAIVPELNRFRGRVTPTLRVRDWRKNPLSN